MACYLCTNAQTATSLMALGAVAARWALLGGGVVTEERSAASSTTTDAWVKVLTSFGQLLQSWYEAWKVCYGTAPRAPPSFAYIVAYYFRDLHR